MKKETITVMVEELAKGTRYIILDKSKYLLHRDNEERYMFEEIKK